MQTCGEPAPKILLKGVNNNMSEAEIMAHAEARSNMTGETLEEAEAVIRANLEAGMTYSEELGWS